MPTKLSDFILLDLLKSRKTDKYENDINLRLRHIELVLIILSCSVVIMDISILLMFI